MCQRWTVACCTLLALAPILPAADPPGDIRDLPRGSGDLAFPLTPALGERDDPSPPSQGSGAKVELRVRPTDDFEVTGDGAAAAWAKAAWVPLHKREANGLPYETRVKVLHSKKGLYVL